MVFCYILPQVIVNKGVWPEQASLAVVIFKTEESASNWFEDFNINCQTTGIEIIDAVMGDTKETYDKSMY